MSELDHELNNDNRNTSSKTTTTTTTITNSKESNMNNKNTNRPVGLPIVVAGYLKLGMPAHLREALLADGSEPLATRRLVRKQTLSFEH